MPRKGRGYSTVGIHLFLHSLPFYMSVGDVQQSYSVFSRNGPEAPPVAVAPSFSSANRRQVLAAQQQQAGAGGASPCGIAFKRATGSASSPCGAGAAGTMNNSHPQLQYLSIDSAAAAAAAAAGGHRHDRENGGSNIENNGDDGGGAGQEEGQQHGPPSRRSVLKGLSEALMRRTLTKVRIVDCSVMLFVSRVALSPICFNMAQRGC